MTKFYSADYILPVSSEPIKDGVIAVNEDGEIVELTTVDDPNIIDRPIEKCEGVIVPGFVNAHCHLELSHLHEKIPRHQGLIPFIRNVINSRGEDDNVVIEAMENADREMYENGIIAVGDISNTTLSKEVKLKSKLFYHTFIELLGFSPINAHEIYKEGINRSEAFAPLRSSITPHAPYSVSKELLRHINHNGVHGENLISIHNQESEEENKFYRYKKGGFLEYYKQLDIDIDFFKPQARNSIQSIVPLLPSEQPVLLVHNTYTSLKDIYFVQRFGREITWCFCPRANLFIENKLPKIDLFQLSDFKITLGTDSLASNDRLCIFSELKTLNEFYPSLDLRKTIAWATLNGAQFLRIDQQYGSLEKGKKPGLNLITNTDGLGLTATSAVKKLV